MKFASGSTCAAGPASQSASVHNPSDGFHVRPAIRIFEDLQTSLGRKLMDVKTSHLSQFFAS
jgi:hypothetical protein